MTAADDLPAVAFVAALAGLPDMGPGRLRSLLGLGAPAEVWHRVRRGAVPTDPGGRGPVPSNRARQRTSRNLGKMTLAKDQGVLF